MIRTFIIPTIRNSVKRVLDCLTWDPWVNRSWSQEGEDMVLRRIFERQNEGFYVDVGAHHPKRFSNTYLFYRKGWSGINIDAMPGSMRLFRKWRPRDINLELGVANNRGTFDYFVFNEPALNGFSVELSNQRDTSSSSYFVKKIIKVDVTPLNEILDNHLGENKIDFLSVDVEGLDLAVLKSNDWVKYRPRYVLTEVLESGLHDLENYPVTKFMNEHGYLLYAKQMNTIFFKDNVWGDQ